jgi:hypothetical chaperone protein
VKLGIDFGTTNSAVAALDSGGNPVTLELVPGERVQRSVLHAATDGSIRFGNAAFAHYVDNDLQGRLLRSLKSFLPQDVPKTVLAGVPTEFHTLVSHYITYLLRAVHDVTGEAVTEVVVGRPVRFHDDPARDAVAVDRLATAITDAGVPRFRFALEPVAAAHRYEHDLRSDRTVLVGDFGGGTADFAVLRVGPSRIGGDRTHDVLGTSGVPRAGDALDGRFMNTFLLDQFGVGSTVRRVRSDESIPWVHPIQRHIQRLYYLHLLRDPALKRRLESVEHRSSDPLAVRRVIRLIFDDLGFSMAWAIEKSKQDLCEQDPATFTFDAFYDPRLDITTEVDLHRFALGSAEILASYEQAIAVALERAGLDRSGIDDVFLTGGSSSVPFVRDLFVGLFGGDKVRSADAFTSVCEGLALA